MRLDAAAVAASEVTVWRKVFELEAQKPEFNLALLLTLALEGKLGKVGSSALNKAFGTLTKGNEGSRLNVKDTATEVVKAGEDLIDRMIGGIAASCFDGLEEIDIQRLLAFMNADLGKHWVLNAEYLGLLTKSEIQVVAEELGLVAHMGDKFQKLMSGKKEEIIKALLEVDGFDYHGKVPGHLQYSR